MTESNSILVIEDSDDDRMLYRRALQENTSVRYEVSEAPDGDTGLRRIEESEPDCVLLDYSLPGRNGVEVLKRLRTRRPFLPVVMLTGQGNEAVAVAAMQAGAQDYLSKAAITGDGLRRAISSAIGHCGMQRRIHEQRQSLEIFTRALAHDLKEPVRTITSFLTTLSERETLTQDGQRYFGYVHAAAERMGALIDAVYYYARLDGSAPQTARETCDLSNVLQDTLIDLSQLVRDRSATVTFDPLPCVHADTRQMHQVLQNLVSNAIRHSDADPVIHIEARSDADNWVIRVLDNGEGVPEQQRDKIFDPFTRFAHRKVNGLGMGLAICKRIVESHGGKLWCEARPEGGSVFQFTLPRASALDDQNTKGAIAREHPPLAASAPNHRELATILVVDDNEAAIELSRIVLVESAKLRCVLLGANGGQEALSMLRMRAEQNGGIDLVLLDINMPRMNGFELLERMKADEALRDIPVVMCTTSNDDQDMDRAKSMGASGYITKPPELRKLRSLLESISTLQLTEQPGAVQLLRIA